MVPVMGLMPFPLSNQKTCMDALVFHAFFNSIKSCYDNGWMAKRLSATKCCIGQAVDAVIHSWEH